MISTALSDHRCQICGNSSLSEFPRFRELRRVTSDSRAWGAGGRITVCRECGAVQKLIEAAWLEEIDQIYRSYVIYHQAGGQEQPIFVGNGAAPQARSRVLLKYLERKMPLAARADVLDFGCGRGSALRTYSECHPEWALFGAELSEQSLALLREIPGFRSLFTCPPGEIPLQFDLVTLLHALEHVLDPVGILRQLSTRLKEAGVLFVQVPDGGKNPYDLVIADHLLHFTVETLGLASRLAGIEIVELSDAVLPKELSLIGRSGELDTPARSLPGPKVAIERVGNQIDWLFAQTTAARAISDNNVRFGIFGTSISGTWLAGVLGNERISFFVDEDAGRIGGQHMERPILSPDQIPDDADVFVPLIANVAEAIVARLSRPTVRFHAPPRLG
jgi:SAM-dependent methyltransferase